MSDEDCTEWFSVAASADLPEGGSLEAIFQSDLIAIFRTDGQLYAIEGTCAHQGGPLVRGRVESGCVQCPWHGWRYNLANGVNVANSKRMLKTFQVREMNGVIEIGSSGNAV